MVRSAPRITTIAQSFGPRVHRPAPCTTRVRIRSANAAPADDIYCVACGHRAAADAFLTDDTRRRIIEIAQATTAHQIAQQMRTLGFDYRPAPMPTTF